MAGLYVTLAPPSALRQRPLWPALLALPTKLLGIHPTMIRVLGLAGFVFMVVAFQRLVARLYGRTWGIVAAFLMAASPWLVYQSSPRGLREEASTGLLLLFVTAVLALLRWDSVMMTVPTLVIAAIIDRPRPRDALLATSVFGVLVAPMLIAAKLNYGNALYFSSTLTPMFFRNVEFAGKPGFPTREEFFQNGYSGPKITWFEYFTQVLTPEETVRRTVNGVTTLPLTMTRCTLFYPSATGWTDTGRRSRSRPASRRCFRG